MTPTTVPPCEQHEGFKADRARSRRPALDLLEGLVFSLPEEASTDDEYVEGAVVEVLANRDERDQKACVQCIEHWGCVLCATA